MDRLTTLPGPRYLDAAIETMPRLALRALQAERLAALPSQVVERTSTSLSLSRHWWELGVRRGDYVAYLPFPFSDDAMIDTLRHLGGTVVPFDHDPAEVDRLATLSRALRPVTLYCLSEAFLHAITTRLERLGLDPAPVFSSYRSMVFAGDALPASLRQTAASWGVELFHCRTFGDVVVAFECRAHDGLHVWEDEWLVEVVDPATEAPVADGSPGELVVTSLGHLSAPRRRTGDRVALVTAPCACGRTHARLQTLGRVD